MKKHNILTGKDKQAFTRERNRAFGSLHWCSTALMNILSTDVVGPLDKIALKTAKLYIDDTIKHWDKHYCSKLFAKLNEEANNENISNQS